VSAADISLTGVLELSDSVSGIDRSSVGSGAEVDVQPNARISAGMMVRWGRMIEGMPPS
jgi:hypothetical protein